MTNPEATGVLPRVLRGDAVGETMYSERWILKQLIKITKFISGEEEFTDDFEIDLCSLWDMCADKEVIAFTRKHGLIALAVNAVMKSQSPRLSEIMVGIIGNMCTSKSVREECKRRTDVIRIMMELLAFPDSPTLIQVMRVLQTFAWEVSNSSQSPQGRRHEDDDFDNDNNEADHNNDYDYYFDHDQMHMHDGEFNGYGYEERNGAQNDNSANNPSRKSESDSSEESSLSDHMEVTLVLPPKSGDGKEECSRTEDKPEEDQDMIDDQETDISQNTNTTIQSQNGENENTISFTSGKENQEVDDDIEKCVPISSHTSCNSETLEPEEMIIPCVPISSDSSSDIETLEPEAGTSADADLADVAGPSGSVASTSGMGNAAHPEGSVEGGASGRGGPSGTGGERRCGGDAWRNIDDRDYDDDDDTDDENPEVVAISVRDGSVITGTAFLWYEQFLKVENWLPEIVYILNSSKNAELIGLTWTLLSILCYIRVGDSYLCCNISGPDVMRGLLESFKEFFGQLADIDNSELLDVTKCRKGLFSWTAVMYSFTLHENCENSCCVFKAVIMKNIFQMLKFFNHFLPVDGDLHEYLIHSYTLLDHVLMSEPYEMSSFRSGMNGILQLLDVLTEEKKKQDGNNIYPRYDEEAIDTTERYLLNVLLWLNRLHYANRLGEFEDVRNRLIAKFG